MADWYFTTPTVDETPMAWNPLHERYRIARGISFVEVSPGVYEAVRYDPYDEELGSINVPRDTAYQSIQFYKDSRFYRGGYQHIVDSDVRQDLIDSNVGITGANFTPIMEYEFLANPDRVRFYADGETLALVTVGAKTVTLQGPERTFTEQKKPWNDQFDRTVATTFGPSPGGGSWSNITGTDANFSVNGTQGVVLVDVANVSRHCSVRDDDVSDFDANMLFTLSVAPSGAPSSVGLSFGYQDSNNQYRARLLFGTSGSISLNLDREIGGSATVLQGPVSLGTGFVAGQKWHIRASRSGNQIMARGWKDGDPEPASWQVSTVDTTFPTGRVGIRSVASTGSTAVPFNVVVDEYVMTSGVWANPPVVTHDRWVRVLDTPFDGNVTQDLIDQIGAWLGDTSEDILATAMRFKAFAPAGFEPSGRQVYGEAGYGPLDTDGTRFEFSDFNDYFGEDWDFPNGEHRDFPHFAITVPYNVDCSGFVRMVFGYHHGIPMVFDLNFDGINLPRRTMNIGPSGPGVLIQDNPSSPPALTGLEVGDIVLFDSDMSEPVEGQIDHNGIFIGIGTDGFYRFISSRKTADGPTFGDLGGKSTIDAPSGSTYANRLRKIRRF